MVRATLSQSRGQSSPCHSTWPRPPSVPVIAELWLRHCLVDGRVWRGCVVHSEYVVLLVVATECSRYGPSCV